MTFEKMLEAWVAFTRLNWEEREQQRRSREPEGVTCKVLKNATLEDGWGWRRGWRGEMCWPLQDHVRFMGCALRPGNPLKDMMQVTAVICLYFSTVIPASSVADTASCLSTQHLMESVLLQGSKLNIGDSM